MDPITAVGFAASILTFIDFSKSVIMGTYEVYKSTSGTTAENVHIKTVVDDLERLTDGLISDVEGKTKHEKELCKLADKCHDLSQDLLKILQKLQVADRNSKWQSLKVKFASMRKEKEIAAIEDRLDRYRSEILVRLNFMLSEQQSFVRLQLDQIQKEGVEMSTESALQFSCLRQELNQAVKALLERKDEAKSSEDEDSISSSASIRSALSKLQLMSRSLSRENCILRRLYFDNINSREENIADAENGTFSWILEDNTEGSIYSSDSDQSKDIDLETDDEKVSTHSTDEEDDKPLFESEESSTAIGSLTGIQSLIDENKVEDAEEELPRRYKSLFSKNGEIKPAGGEESVIGDIGSGIKRRKSGAESYREREMREQTRESFLTWLRSGNQIYHISGKAGAGKSTLLKFLGQHRRVQEELESWAAEKKLVFSQFFFWNSGERLQMSLEGLYRALLFETLKQCPELIPEIFPNEWDSLGSATSKFESPAFRMAEVKAAFAKLISKRVFPKHRICFFIDGLDEYEGDSVDHWKLAASLQSWASSTDIKICVSSRPHTEFMQTFSDDPTSRIYLHELTRHDISRFASAMFENDPNFDRVKSMYMELVDDVVAMANGVFLWARLVVRSLLEGVGHHDSESALHEKLNTIPRDLDALFAKLLGSISPSDRKRSDQMLLLATGNSPKDPMNAIAYSWLEELGDPNFPFSSPVQGYSDEEIKKRYLRLRPQLDSLSKGLLEMVSQRYPSDELYFGYTVQFFHRTVRDYLQDDLRQRQFKSRLPDFDQDDAYSRLCLAELKFARTKRSLFEASTSLWHILDAGILWHARTYQEGHKAQFDFPKAVSNVLDTYRRQPFSHPEEKTENTGIINWGLYSSYSGDDLTKNISFLHYAARMGHYEYVSREISENPALLRGFDGMNVLLSASFAGHARLVRFLLESGANFQAHIGIIDGKERHVRTATIWMLYLLELGQVILSTTNWPGLDDRISVLEEFLRFRVDTDVTFLLSKRDSTYSYQDDLSVDGADEELEDQKPKREIFSITFENFLCLRKQDTLNSLALLREKEKRSFWSKKSSIITRLLPWAEPSVPTAPEYKTFELTEVQEREWVLVGVLSKSGLLESGIRYRIY